MFQKKPSASEVDDVQYYHNTQTASTNGILRKTTHFHQIPSQQVLQKKSGGFAAKGILMNKA